MDWKETFEDLWWGSFDNNGEKNSHEYEKMVSFIENLLEQERQAEYNRCVQVLDFDHTKCPIAFASSCIGYQNAQSDLMNNPPIINKK